MLNREALAHQIASMAQRAVLYEVTATPKPGLVDRNDSGAHNDMDFYTFMDSSVSLYRGFFDCAKQGLNFEGNDLSQLLNQIRRPGMACESQMFKATKGINTHKGIIFSLGICCAAAGYLQQKARRKASETELLKAIKMESVCEVAALMCANLIETDFEGIESKPLEQLTYGEKLYLQLGIKGIRGEAASGFKTVKRETFAVLRAWHKKPDLLTNDLLLELLLRLMRTCEDSNVLSRGGLDGLVAVKRQAKTFIEAGGMRQEEAHLQLRAMNLHFCDQRLSPGGSADLLSVAAFLAMNEGIL